MAKSGNEVRPGPAAKAARLGPRVLFVVNAEWYFCSHRLPLARALVARGFEVVVAAASERGQEEAIRRAGCRFVPLTLVRRSLNPFRELGVVWQLVRLYRRERPDVVHHLTVKPVLYGSFAARLSGVKAVIHTLPGLGYLFTAHGRLAPLRTPLARAGYWAALRVHPTSRVIFQNPDDREYFLRHRLLPAARAVLIRGSGVDLDVFRPTAEQADPPLVVFAARMLWDKGVGELVEAVRRLRQEGLRLRCALVGFPDTGNPRAVPVATLEAWVREGIVEWWGHRDDMAAVLAAASVVVLPSTYREGVPRVLIEAAAAGRAIVSSDVPGCREIVRHGVNGLLVAAGDAASLASAIRTLVEQPRLRADMGRAGRLMAEREFGEQVVIDETLAVYEAMRRDGLWPAPASPVS